MMRPRHALLILPLLVAACGGAPDSADKSKELSSQEQRTLVMADNLRQSGNLDGAAEMYRELAANSHGSVAGHLGLASILRQEHKPEEAVAVLRAAQKLQPDNAQVLLPLGSAWSHPARQRKRSLCLMRCLAPTRRTWWR